MNKQEIIDKINKAKEQELEPFKDDYFKNLDTKTIAKLAKKSIRITAEYCKLENILRDIKEICLQQNLKGNKLFGTVYLPNTHRSEVAELAGLLTSN